MTEIKSNKAVFQYTVIGLTVAALLLEMTSFCSTGWLRFEGTTGNNTDWKVSHQTRSRRNVNHFARLPGRPKTSTFKPPSAERPSQSGSEGHGNSPNLNTDSHGMSDADRSPGPSSSSGDSYQNGRPRPPNFPNTRSPSVSRITSNALTKRPLISAGNGAGRDPRLPGRQKPPSNNGTSRSPPSKGQQGNQQKPSLKPKPDGGKSSGRLPLSSRRPEVVPLLDPYPNAVTKKPLLNWKPSPSEFIEMSTVTSGNTKEGVDDVHQRVILDIGLWSVQICEQKLIGEGYSCKRKDKLNDVNESDVSLTEVQTEAVFAIIFGVVGCISTALALVPSCLKGKRQILLIFAICGLILSGLLHLITIARVVSLNPKIEDIAGREYNNLRMKTPWCLVVGGIGAGLAFVSSGLLATGQWLDKQKVWSELSDEVEFSREPNSPQTERTG